MQNLITISQAAEIIGVSQNTVRKWLDSGKVQYHVRGWRKMIEKETAQAIAAGVYTWQHGNKKRD
jgi:excisionase family DNA binding protein